MEPVRELAFGSWFAADGRHRCQNVQDLCHVIDIGCRDGDVERDALSIGQDMVFASGFATIRRVWAGIFASFRCFGQGGVDQGAFPIDLVGAIEFGQKERVQFEPHSGLVPELQMLSAGFAATAAEFGGQIIPGNAGLEYEEDAGENHAIIERFAPWKALPPWRMRRQQGLNTFPERVRDKRFHGKTPGILAGRARRFGRPFPP